jgi:hypothetical protein
MEFGLVKWGLKGNTAVFISALVQLDAGASEKVTSINWFAAWLYSATTG